VGSAAKLFQPNCFSDAFYLCKLYNTFNLSALILGESVFSDGEFQGQKKGSNWTEFSPHEARQGVRKRNVTAIYTSSQIIASFIICCFYSLLLFYSKVMNLCLGMKSLTVTCFDKNIQNYFMIFKTGVIIFKRIIKAGKKRSLI